MPKGNPENHIRRKTSQMHEEIESKEENLTENFNEERKSYQ